MPRITPVEGRQVTPLLRLLNWVSRRTLGHEVLPLKILAHNPRLLLPHLGVSRLVAGKTQLAPGIRALATQLVAELNGCAWCIDYGQHEGGRRGIAADKLIAVRDYAMSPLFSPAERAALAFAESATQVGARVSDELFADLRRHFSEREIVELAVAVAAENYYNRLNVPLGIEAQGFCAMPARHVDAGRQTA